MGTPVAVMLLARKWRWIDKVSPMAVLYVVGLLVANLTSWISSGHLLTLNNTIGNICIPLAIPLMLISCSLSHWSTGKALKCFLGGLLAIVIVIVVGFYLFRGQYEVREFAQVSAVAVGIYTGGIPNMGAIAHGVGMDQETYLYVTSYDLIVTGLYLVFVIFFGKPVFRKLLPSPTQEQPRLAQKSTPQPHTTMETDKSTAEIAIPLLLTLAIAAISYLVSTLLPDSMSTPILILILTTLSIAASFLPVVRKINRRADQENRQTKSFTMGLYFVYLFCFTIANACDLRQMDLAGSLNILWYILFVIFGSLLLQILFARLLKLDGDSTLVTSVALINSPPFVPMVAALLGNKDLIILGITIGLLGYMIGNYMGLGIFYLLINI